VQGVPRALPVIGYMKNTEKILTGKEAKEFFENNKIERRSVGRSS
jgi:hypothetical protein